MILFLITTIFCRKAISKNRGKQSAFIFLMIPIANFTALVQNNTKIDAVYVPKQFYRV